MNPTLITVLLCLFAGIAFGAVRILLIGRPISPFWVDVLSFTAGLAVFALRSFLGVPLT